MIKTDRVDGSRDGPSWSRRTVMDSVVPYLCKFFCCSPHYPRRQVGRTVIGTTFRRGSSFQNTSTLKCGYWDRLSELHDGTGARTVVDTMGRHKLHNPDWVGFPLKFKWVFWTIHDYNYGISGVSLIIYLLGG